MKHTATGYWAQLADVRDNCSNSAIIAEQNGWQAYYQYAKQLYATGDQLNADQYFAYAQQLYNAELEKEKQMAVVGTQTNHRDSASRTDYYNELIDQDLEQECVTQVSPPPTWETYYTYAKQLYAAGYRKQAEAYYRQAQQVFNQSSNDRTEYQSPQPSVSDSYMPQQSFNQSSNNRTEYQSPQPSVSDSYMPSKSNQMIASNTFESANDDSVLTDINTIAVNWPRRSPNRQVKSWAPTSLVIGSLIVIGGLIGLFLFHKNQQNQRRTDSSHDNSISGQFKSSTFQSMVDVFQPIFDKTIRLSLAAQPLLYELSIRDTPPEKLYSKTSNKDKPLEGEGAKLAKQFETNDANTINETGSPVGQEKADAVASAASAPSDESDGQAIGSPKDPEAPGEMVFESEEDVQEDAAVEKKTSSSHRRSRRSTSRNSVESPPQQYVESERVESPPQQPAEVKSVESHPQQSPQQSPDNMSASEEDDELIAVSKKPSKTRELDILLAGGKPKAKPSPPSNPSSRSSVLSTATSTSSSFDQSTSSVKESLSRSDVQQGMAQVASAVKRCGQGKGGIISLNIAIGKNGRISSAVAAGAFSGTPIGACAERAVRQARFSASQKSLSVKYPFKL